jgi:hypothetical protein
MIAFEYFVLNIYPPLTIFFGVIGNTLGFIVLSRKAFSRLSTRNFMRLLSCLDTFFVLQMTADYLTNAFNIDIRMISPFWCKAFIYINFLAAISSWMLVFINVEATMSIIPSNSLASTFKKKNFQLSVTVIIIVWNLVYYSPYFIFNDWVPVTSSNDTAFLNETLIETVFECTFSNETASRILPLMDLFNSTLIPFTILVSSSFNSIFFIFRSRAILAARLKNCKNANERNKATKNNQKLRRDIKFSVTLLFINFMYLCFNLPICIANYIETSFFLYICTNYLWYTFFATEFWLLFLFNSLFLNELLFLLRIKKTIVHKNNTATIF